MNIIPAIDLKDGKCVRLFKGNFSQSTEYSDEPLRIARQFAALDVADLHIVDLDGARTGSQRNVELISQICELAQLRIQLGGGIRDAARIREWLDRGVARCVIGSIAVENPAQVCKWLDEFAAERIVLALDVRIQNGEPNLATQGWTRTSDVSLWQALETYTNAGLRHVLCTDISRDGALSGPNVELYRDLLARFPGLVLQASGGVRDVADLHELANAEIPSAITGRALLDGRISAAEVASFQPNA